MNKYLIDTNTCIYFIKGKFDLLIGVTAVTHDLIMVTNNFDHFKRIKGITIEDWTK